MNQKDFYFNSYAKFAKKITKKNSHILSARYKFLTFKYKYICEDICEKLSLNKSDDNTGAVELANSVACLLSLFPLLAAPYLDE